MLNKNQVLWKNKSNAIAWCKRKGYRFLDTGAFDVFYVTPEQEGTEMQGLAGRMEAYSSKNWLDVFAEMNALHIPKIKSKH